MGNPADELEELNEDHVLGARKIALGVLHGQLGEAPARRDRRVSDHHRASHGMLLRHFRDTLNELQGPMLREKPLIENDLGPVAVHAPQYGHVADQYLADFDLLDVRGTEFLPRSLSAELDQQVLEKVAHAADHVINEVFLRHLDGSGDCSATDSRDHALHV